MEIAIVNFIEIDQAADAKAPANVTRDLTNIGQAGLSTAGLRFCQLKTNSSIVLEFWILSIINYILWV